jgi:hypothetical protein
VKTNASDADGAVDVRLCLCAHGDTTCDRSHERTRSPQDCSVSHSGSVSVCGRRLCRGVPVCVVATVRVRAAHAQTVTIQIKNKENHK